MKKYLSFFVATIILFAACKKSNEVSVIPEHETMTDFLYLPVKDAVWKIHTQGGVKGDLPYPCSENSKSDFDTAWHFNYEITATGVNVMIKNKKYYKYLINYSDHVSNCPDYPGTEYQYTAFYREDTAAKQILMYTGEGGRDEVVADFATEQPGNIAQVSPFWPDAQISNLNEILINDKTTKMWEMVYNYKPNTKYFYKAYGVGSQTGFLPKWRIAESQPISIDFTYKGATNHFDFPFFPDHKIQGWGWW